MRSVTIVLLLFFAALSGWLWHQLRDTWGSFNNVVVIDAESKLKDARELEAMLREGRVDEALGHLQTRRDTWVLSLRDVSAAIDKKSWRWKRDAWAVDKAAESLRDEAAYRQTHNPPATRLSGQVAKALQDFE